MRRIVSFWLFSFSAILVCSTFLPCSASAGLIKLAESNDVEPNGTNTFFEIGASPTLNENGQVIFYTDLRNDGFLQGWGLFLADANGVKTVARTGQASPDLNGNFYTFNGEAALNNSSQVFEVGLKGSLGGGADNSGIYRVEGNTLSIVARAGQPTPGGGDVFRTVQGITPRINHNGQVAFRAQTTTNPFVIMVASRSNVLSQVAYAGQSSPDGNGQLLGVLGNPELNNNGKISFVATTTGTINNSTFGVYLGDSSGLTALARGAQPVPGGDGQLSLLLLNELAFNDSDQVAFVSLLTGTAAGTVDNLGLFRAGPGEFIQLARKSQFVPGGNGRFLDFGGQPRVAINNAGTVAFLADLTGTTGGTADNAAIYLANGTNLTQVVRKGQAAPDGNGVFSVIHYPAINNNGEVAFVATLSSTKGGTTDNQGVYFVDSSLTVRQAIRAGQLFNGETIALPNFVDGPNYGGLSGFNDKGQLAIWSDLNGNNAVFLWSKTDLPAGLQLLASAPSGKDVSVTFQALGGTTNHVQAAPSPEGAFVDIRTIVLPGTGLITTNYTEPGTATNKSRFYRIRQLK